MQEAVERLVGYDAWFIQQVEIGLAQIESGEVLDEQEVAQRMENLILKNGDGSDSVRGQ